MIALDTSVAVPAFLPWHDAHQRCHRAVLGASAPAHVYVETYAVLTRLPAPHRLTDSTAQQLLARRFGAHLLLPSDGLVRSVVDRLAAAGVSGGATYDGIIALTAVEHGAELVTRDARAASTYEALGVRYQLLGD